MMKKEDMSLENREGHLGGFRRRKGREGGKGEMLYLNYNPKIKRKMVERGSLFIQAFLSPAS